ncbi:hypothetical protein [Cetobacterium sp.]|uniref:hypothetical protein n=1 Tax=Cetobacterium sp. TaxID=2071632 RepID=UPI003F36EF17
MKSKAHILYAKHLERLCLAYKIPLFKELKAGSKSYDFYIPTNPPIVLEVDGIQHENTKVDKFFFKNLDSLQKYRENDKERNFLFNVGKIHLIRIKSNVFLSFAQFIELLEETKTFEILDLGVDIENAYFRTFERDRERKEKRRRENKLFKKQRKEKDSSRN